MIKVSQRPGDWDFIEKIINRLSAILKSEEQCSHFFLVRYLKKSFYILMVENEKLAMKEVNIWHCCKGRKVQNKVAIVYILIICIYQCDVLKLF